MTLPPIISDHMVLQRSSRTAVWGSDTPGTRVTVILGSIQAQAIASASGKWKAELDLTSIAEGPFDMEVIGTTRVIVTDVVIGEVWLCAGQSNMAFTLDRSIGGAEQIAQSANPRLRQFRVVPRATDDLEEECAGSWIAASPSTASQFSGVGYYFAKGVQQELRVPMGIVLAAWAGSIATAWISDSALNADPELKAISEKFRQAEADYPLQRAAYINAMPAWEMRKSRQDWPFDAEAFNSIQNSLDDWKLICLPGNFAELGLPDAGAVWMRRTISIASKPEPGISVTIDPGGPHDFTAIYWNGQKIGGMDETSATGKSDTKRYTVPPDLVIEDENVLAIRVFTPTERGGISAAPFIDVGPKRTLIADHWLAKAEFELPPLTAQSRHSLPHLPSAPEAHHVGGRLFNGMISPLTSYTLAGVVWYQGEQDAGRSTAQYLKILKTLISDWRRAWLTDLPFIICQLPNFGAKANAPQESNWAAIRQAQLEALSLPKTALAVLIDVGDRDVHPLDKKPVGDRVALAALGAFYGQPILYSGPRLQSLHADENRLILHFHSQTGNLIARQLPLDYAPTALSPERQSLTRNSPGGDVEGFALCGKDEIWCWANAAIDGQAVIVSSPAVPRPIAVRYAWAENPTSNLYNSAQLPASPFEAILPCGFPRAESK